jgi:restriction system protein
MPRMWGVHNDQPQLELVENGFISIGWLEMGDLSVVGNDKEAMKAKVAATYPDIKPGAIPGTAGTLLTFVYRIQVGDLVVYPHRPDSTLNFGRVAGEYEYHRELPLHRNRRKVEWLRTGVPRTDFSEGARFEVGSAITIFQVKRHVQEFLDFLAGTSPVTPVAGAVDPDDAADVATNAVSAERIEDDTRDFIVATLMRELEGADFERFVAHLLACMGYRTRVTQASGDGGVDIIAHKDPLGLEPPIIKVQCKRSTSSMGGPVVQNLVGTLSPGGSELGLFVTLGSFSKDALHIERTRQDLRLINGKELVDLVFEHYEQLDPKYKRMLPMRSVYVVKRELDAG